MELIEYLGKTVRFSYKKNGQENAITGRLSAVTDEKIKVGDMWIELVPGWDIELVEFKGA